ncbi:MAG: YihY/virulence factor BrkB family protein [Solirubrobacteraceae bacterium]
MAGSIAERLGRHRLRDVARETVRGVGRHDLLTFGSAIAFQVATAIPPLLMLSLALAGALGFGDVWRETVAPQFQQAVSHDVFVVADRAARAALSSQAAFWLTFGVAFTIWEMSGAVRALMTALSRIYGDDDHRSRTRRYLTSFALSLALVVLPLGALALLQAAGTLGIAGQTLRWPVAAALLAGLVWLVQRYAPDHPREHRFVSLGTVICVAAWLATSAVFAVYVTDVAVYGSIFSSLAVVFVALLYLYVSACAFLIGAEVDAVLAREVERG